MYAISKVNDRTYRYSMFAVRYLRYWDFAIRFDRSSWIQILRANVVAINVYYQLILEDSDINFVPIFIEDLFQTNVSSISLLVTNMYYTYEK